MTLNSSLGSQTLPPSAVSRRLVRLLALGIMVAVVAWSKYGKYATCERRPRAVEQCAATRTPVAMAQSGNSSSMPGRLANA